MESSVDSPTDNSDDRASASPNVERRQSQAVPIDLRVLDYVDGYDKNLMCPICHCPFIQGTKLPCDHTFCQQCVTRAFTSQRQSDKTCPSCRAVTLQQDLTPVPRFITHMIDDLVVKCPKYADGCTRTLRRSDVQYHANADCSFAEVACSNTDCKLRIPRHMRSENCLHQLTICEDCRKQFMLRDIRKHTEEECEKREWACEHCQVSVTARDQAKHGQECSETTVSCSGSAIGCPFFDRRIAVHHHQRTCPMALMFPAISNMTARLDQQEASLNSLRQRNGLLESGLESLKATLDNGSTLSRLADSRAHDNASPTAAARETAVADAPFDSATHHLLSLHETLREEIERVSGSVTELDARSSVMTMNENLRLKEDMAHLNAVVSSMRIQVQWLTSARLQAQQRPPRAPGTASASVGRSQSIAGESGPSGPIRRLSDSTTKL